MEIAFCYIIDELWSLIKYIWLKLSNYCLLLPYDKNKKIFIILFYFICVIVYNSFSYLDYDIDNILKATGNPMDISSLLNHDPGSTSGGNTGGNSGGNPHGNSGGNPHDNSGGNTNTQDQVWLDIKEKINRQFESHRGRKTIYSPDNLPNNILTHDECEYLADKVKNAGFNNTDPYTVKETPVNGYDPYAFKKREVFKYRFGPTSDKMEKAKASLKFRDMLDSLD